MAIAGNKATTARIDADAVTGAKVADDAINSEHYTDGSIDTDHIADDQVTYAKMQHTSTANRVLGAASTGAIGEVQVATAMIAADAVNGDKLADDACNSEHYTDGSIDTDHIADNQVTVAKLADIARGSLIIGNASAASAELTKGSANTVLTSDGTDIAWAAAGGGTSNAERNAIINGDFTVAQRGTSFTAATSTVTSEANNDDTYHLDRWYTLSDGNDIIDITRVASADTGQALYAIGLDVETVDKKFGIAQIIEDANCQDMIGGTASLSFRAKVAGSGKLDNVKAAVIAWSGSANAVTSDVVSSWGSEGTNPTLASNLTYENTPANLSVTTSWADYKIENISIDTASTTNLVVFIWSDVTDTDAGDFLYLTDIQLEPGATANEFLREDYATQEAKCQRYFINPYNVVGSAYSTQGVATGYAFPVKMRTSPTIVLHNGAAQNQCYIIQTGAAPSITPTAFSNPWALTHYYFLTGSWTGGVGSAVMTSFQLKAEL